MSIKMVLVPADQYYQQKTTPAKPKEDPAAPATSVAPPPSSTHAPLPPDVELKLRRQYEQPYEAERNLVPVADMLKTPPGRLKAPAIGEKLDSLLMHLNQNRDRVKADKRTGELFFDGKIVPGSDVRRLFGDVVSPREKSIKPLGWEELRDVLEFTRAPEHVLGQEWSKVNARAASKKAERKHITYKKNRPRTRAANLEEGKRPKRTPIRRVFKPSDWQNL